MVRFSYCETKLYLGNVTSPGSGGITRNIRISRAKLKKKNKPETIKKKKKCTKKKSGSQRAGPEIMIPVGKNVPANWPAIGFRRGLFALCADLLTDP